MSEAKNAEEERPAMTPLEQASAILKAAEEATPGPWKKDNVTPWIWAPSEKGGDFHLCEMRGWGYYTGGGHGALNLSADEASDHQTRDAAFIALARNTAPAIALALIEKHRALEEAEARIAQLESLLAEAPAVLRACNSEIYWLFVQSGPKWQRMWKDEKWRAESSVGRAYDAAAALSTKLEAQP